MGYDITKEEFLIFIKNIGFVYTQDEQNRWEKYELEYNKNKYRMYFHVDETTTLYKNSYKVMQRCFFNSILGELKKEFIYIIRKNKIKKLL